LCAFFECTLGVRVRKGSIQGLNFAANLEACKDLHPHHNICFCLPTGHPSPPPSQGFRSCKRSSMEHN